MNNFRQTLLLLALLIAAAAVFGSSCSKLKAITAKVQVQVMDQSGRPQGYVSVRLIDVETSKIAYQDSTEDNGSLMLSEIQPGKYKIEIADIAGNVIPSDDQEVSVGPGRTVQVVATINRNAAGSEN